MWPPSTTSPNPWNDPESDLRKQFNAIVAANVGSLRAAFVPASDLPKDQRDILTQIFGPEVLDWGYDDLVAHD